MSKLHPLSPLLRGFRMLVVAIVAVSWQGLEQLGFKWWLIVVAILCVGLLVYAFIAWQFTGYEVVGRELRIHEGVLSRRVRTVPLERLQAIEVIQPVQARPFGLAELKLDVAGAQRAEAPLSFLRLGDARSLRERLLNLSAGDKAVPREEDEATDRELFRVDNNDVILSQFLTTPVLFTPLAIAYTVGQFVYNPSLGFFAIASMVTALGATVLAPVTRMLNFWDFRLAQDAEGKLRIRQGLLTALSKTVPVQRIQSLTVSWPMLWRSKGWLRITLSVAGQGGGGESGGRGPETDRLLPVATLETARAVMPYVMPSVDIAALPMTGVPSNARWLAPLSQPILAAGLHERTFTSVEGLFTRTLTVVPYERIQSVRLSQGPVARKLGLATVHADIAGGSPVSAAHRPLAEAYAWADELSRRAHAARSQ